MQGATLADIIAQTSGVTSPISGDLILHLGSADSPLANNINTSATSANHAFDIDGTVSGSMVSGNITVNNQTSVAAINKRVFAVAASSKFGLRVKAAGAVIVNNDGSINFTAGNDNLGAIYVASGTAGGDTSVTNSQRLGFVTPCTTNCGSGHKGIQIVHANSTAVSVSNTGSILLAAQGIGAPSVDNASAIDITFSGQDANATITNTGTITLSGSGSELLLLSDASGGLTTLNLNNGSVVDASDAQLADGSGYQGRLIVNANNGSRTNIRFGGTAGDDQLNINSGAIFALTQGNSDWRAGSDSLTVNGGGTVAIGDGFSRSSDVTITGLETFTLNANSTLRLYLDSDKSTFNLGGALVFNGTVAPVLDIYLTDDDSDRGIPGNQIIPFTLINSSGITLGRSLTLANLAARVRIHRNGSMYTGDITLAQDGGKLDLAWRNLYEIFNPTSMSCRGSSSISCTGGTVGAQEFVRGLNLGHIFAATNNSTINGDLILTINDIADNVNSSGIGSGFVVNGDLSTSKVTGSITVNYQTSSTVKRTTFVRTSQRSAIRIKSAKSVTLHNAGDLIFDGVKSDSANFYGVYATSASDGNITITNSGTVGFANACTANCGTAHYGLIANHAGTGTVNVTNSGTIRVSASTANSYGIIVFGPSTGAGSATDTITITNTGVIEGDNSVATYLLEGESNDRAIINLNGGRVDSSTIVHSRHFRGRVNLNVTGGVNSGSIDFGSGNDTITVSGGTLQITDHLTAGTGTDTLNVNSGGRLTLGSEKTPGTSLRFSGLETFNINAGSTLRLFHTGTGNASSFFRAFDYNLAFNGTNASDAPILELFVAGTVFAEFFEDEYVLIQAPTITVSDALLNLMAGRIVVNQNGYIYTGTFSLEKARLTYGVQTRLNNNNRNEISAYRTYDVIRLAEVANLTIEDGLTCQRTQQTVAVRRDPATNPRTAPQATISCGSAASFLSNVGIDLGAILQNTSNPSSRVFDGYLIISFDNLGRPINENGSGHGININGSTRSVNDTQSSVFDLPPSQVTGHITVNNQTNTSSAAKQAVYVGANNKAAMFVVSEGTRVVPRGSSSVGSYTEYGDITIDNQGDLLFTNIKADSKSFHGIRANAIAAGHVTISNSATIGLTAACTSDCGDSHVGILAQTAFGNISITNSGIIRVASSSDSASYGIKVMSPTSADNDDNDKDLDITNRGSILGSGKVTAIKLGGGHTDDNTTINFDGGTVDAEYILDSTDFAGDVAITIGNNSIVTGGIKAGAGTNDSLTVNNGVFSIGSANRASHEVAITGLETFTINAGATLRFFLERKENAFETVLTLDGTLDIQRAFAIEIRLPVGFDLTNPHTQTAFTFITAATLTDSSNSLSSVDVVFRSHDGRLEYGVESFTLVRDPNDAKSITLAWTGLTDVPPEPTSLSCSLARNAIGCSLGDRTQLSQAGIDFRKIFLRYISDDPAEPQRHPYQGSLSINLNNFSGNINTTGSRHGIEINGADSNSRVTGDLTVNLMIGGVKRNVFVNGAGRSALFVKSQQAVTINNGANLYFNSTNSSLTAMHVEAGGDGDVIITNSGDLGFVFSTSGNDHRGINVVIPGEGDVTVTNSGTINLAGANSHAIYIGGSANTGNITVYNIGRISTEGDILRVTGGGDVTYTEYSGNTATGGFSTGAGDDTINVSAGGRINISDSNFGDGNDTVNVSGHLNMGKASLSGLENFNVKSGSTLEIVVGGTFSAGGNFTGSGILIGDAGTNVTIEAGTQLYVRLEASSGTAGEFANTNTITFSNGLIANGGSQLTIKNSDGSDAGTNDSGAIVRRILEKAAIFVTVGSRTYQYTGTSSSSSFNEATTLSSLVRRGFTTLAGDDALNQRQRAIATALQEALVSSDDTKVFDDLLDVVANFDDAQSIGDALDRVAAPIYGSLVQSSWLADRKFAHQILNQSCGEDYMTGDKNRQSFQMQRRDGVTECRRSALWGSYIRKDSKDGIGFNEDSPINLAAFWNVSVMPKVNLSLGGGYSFLRHENKLGGESDGHRFLFAAAGYYNQHGMTDHKGLKAGGGVTMSVTTHNLRRETFGGAEVESRPLFLNYGVHGQISYRIQSPDFYFEPNAGASIMQVHMRNVTESVKVRHSSTAPFTLDVVDHTTTFASLHGGFLVGGDYHYSGRTGIKPLVRVGMTYVVSGSDDIDIESRFAGENVGTMTYRDSMEDFFIDFATGVVLFADDDLTGSLDYEGVYGLGGDTRSHSATFKMSF